MHTVSSFQVKHLSGENRCMYTHADLQNWQKEPSTEKSLLLSMRTLPEPQKVPKAGASAAAPFASPTPVG